MKKENLVSEIEHAFGRNHFPWGMAITIDSDMGDYPDVRRHFRRRDWWECDARYLKSQDGAFTFMTNEAQLYFTPAFMLASLNEPGAADTVQDNFVWNLDGALLRLYTTEQLRSVIHFLEYQLTNHPYNYKSWRKVLTLAKSIESGPRD